MANPPSYSKNARLAKSILYTNYNDVMIYVEDTSLEHLYLKLFTRLLGENIKIRRVFGLGGKDPLVAGFEAYKTKSFIVSKPCFFLADLDLDPYLDIPLINDDCMGYLEEYCIENYLIEEFAFGKSLEWKFKELFEDLLSKIDFQTWLNDTVDALFELHLAFVLCRKYNLGESLQLSPYKFIENNGYTIDDHMVRVYKDELKEKYNSSNIGSEEEFNLEIEQIKERILDYTSGEIKRVISGKYLFASLIRYASHLCKTRIDEEFFIGHLVENFSISKLQYIKEKIEKIVS